MARLAALVPPPRMHLTRCHGVFAPHSRLRAAATPARRGLDARKPSEATGELTQPPTPRNVATSRAQRLQRVLGIEIEACADCGGCTAAQRIRPTVTAGNQGRSKILSAGPHAIELEFIDHRP
jgi:hypothetical protein